MRLVSRQFAPTLCFALILCICSFANAQTANITPLIKAWKVADTSQTRIAETTYAPLRLKNNPNKYKDHQKVVAEFKDYLKKNQNDRLQAR